MVISGEIVAHQPTRTERGIISNPIPAKESPGNGQSEHGQLNSCLLHPPQGRDPLPGTYSDKTGTLELVHTQRHLSGCPPCSRKIQCPSRHRIKGFPGRDGLEARPPGNQTFLVSVLDRPLCQQTDSATQTVHKLETGPRGLPNRCSKCQLEQSKRICLPSFQFGASCSEQSSGRPDRDSSGCSGLASTALVTTRSEPADSGTQASTEHEVSLAKSSTGSPNVPTPSSGRLSCLVQRYETEGFSKDVANLLVAATRSSTSKTYESSWRRWCIWCAPRKVNPLSATLDNI